MSFKNELSAVSKSKYATGALYAGMLGLLLSDIIPTVGDAFYFSHERKLRNEFYDKKITPEQYWRREAFAYYGYNTAFWLLFGLIVVNIKGDAAKKLKVGAWIIGAGAAVTVLYKNIKKDKLDLAKELAEKTELENKK